MRTVKVYRMNDYDWMAAETLEEAKKEYLANYGTEVDEPRMLSGGAMDQLIYTRDLDDKVAEGDPSVTEKPKWTFAEQLASMIKLGQKFPAFFASTEF